MKCGTSIASAGAHARKSSLRDRRRCRPQAACAASPAANIDENGALSSADALTDEERAAGEANTAGYQNLDESLTAEQRAEILAQYGNIHHEGVRDDLYEKAILYYDLNYGRITNRRYLTVVDFKLHSVNKRFYVLDMEGGPIASYVVAHGTGSDEDNDGVADTFSNIPGSNMSSLGFYATAETYIGAHGRSLRLDGLSPTNSKVRERLVVIHSATYVEEGREKQGRSYGCLALSEAETQDLITKLMSGSIIYASN
jgi:hypothetical protein